MGKKWRAIGHVDGKSDKTGKCSSLSKLQSLAKSLVDFNGFLDPGRSPSLCSNNNGSTSQRRIVYRECILMSRSSSVFLLDEIMGQMYSRQRILLQMGHQSPLRLPLWAVRLRSNMLPEDVADGAACVPQESSQHATFL